MVVLVLGYALLNWLQDQWILSKFEIRQFFTDFLPICLVFRPHAVWFHDKQGFLEPKPCNLRPCYHCFKDN